MGRAFAQSIHRVIVVLILTMNAHAQTSDLEEKIETNLDLMRELAERIGERVTETILPETSDTLSIVIRPVETAWYIESGLMQGISKGRWTIARSDRRGLSAEFGVRELQVNYSNIRKDGILGSRLVDRTVTVTMSVRVTDERSGVIRLLQDFSESRTGMVRVDAIRELENPNIKITQGALPAEGFFAGVIEPLIALGAVAVAVFLLFSVRS